MRPGEKRAETYLGGPCAKSGHRERYVASRGCVACRRNTNRQWYLNNKGRARAHNAKGQGRCPIADAEAINTHNGACAICRTTEPGKQGWHVDHAHNGTGDVRGVLCSSCNLGLGRFKDSVLILEKAITYLSQPPRYPAKQK